MRIAIVHYHLSPGGVTTVIHLASHALKAEGIPHVILTGSVPEPGPVVRVVEGLGYLECTTLTAAHLLANMRAAAADALGGPPDVWHFHNHSLGKNILIPDVVHLLAEAGERLVLQLHDLAEDGRPQNYPLIAGNPHLYPISPRIRYAFLNARDRGHFRKAGLPVQNCALLPNTVSATRLPAAPSGPPLVFYPSRAIRRKNIGEILLLSLLAPYGTRFAISRAPENPPARRIHDEWRSFSEVHGLPVEFQVVDRVPPHPGADASYTSWLAASTHLATTSVAEGFGMVFPEAIARGRPLIGRELATNPCPGVHTLYGKILIPAGWLDSAVLLHHLEAALIESHELYAQPLTEEPIIEAWEAIHEAGHLDFANLPESLQRKALLHVIDKGPQGLLIENEPAQTWLARAIRRVDVPSTSSITPPAKKSLSGIYTSLQDRPSSPASYLDPGKVLHTYLTPEKFHFLLTPPPRVRAVIFDIYGTLLISKGAGIKSDPTFDPQLSAILTETGFTPPSSPTSALHEIVRRHHAASLQAHPEIDLRALWKELLNTNEDLTPLILRIEQAWHPVSAMPGAADLIHNLSARGIKLGLLSNAQINTLPDLGPMAGAFDPTLSILSYQHLIAKPSPVLFHLMAEKLAALGIAPSDTLYVGNDPLQDIVPASLAGFRTALFTGHSDSLRPGDCDPDFVITSLSQLERLPVF